MLFQKAKEILTKQGGSENESETDNQATYPVVIALLGDIREINKYCSLAKLRSYLEIPRTNRKFWLTSLPSVISGRPLKKVKDIQTNIDNFRKALKSKRDGYDSTNDGPTLKLNLDNIIKKLKLISGMLPALHAQYIAAAMGKQPESNDKKLDSDTKKLFVNIGNCRLYDNKLKLDIYGDSCDTLKIRLEEMSTYLKNDKFPTFDDEEKKYIKAFAGTISTNSINFEAYISQMSNSMPALEQFLNSSKIKKEAKKDPKKSAAYEAIESLVANLERDLKYIKKHMEYAKKVDYNENNSQIIDYIDKLIGLIDSYKDPQKQFGKLWPTYLLKLLNETKKGTKMRIIAKEMHKSIDKCNSAKNEDFIGALWDSLDSVENIINKLDENIKNKLNSLRKKAQNVSGRIPKPSKPNQPK